MEVCFTPRITLLWIDKFSTGILVPKSGREKINELYEYIKRTMSSITVWSDFKHFVLTFWNWYVWRCGNSKLLQGSIATLNKAGLRTRRTMFCSICAAVNDLFASSVVFQRLVVGCTAQVPYSLFDQGIPRPASVFSSKSGFFPSQTLYLLATA